MEIREILARKWCSSGGMNFLSWKLEDHIFFHKTERSVVTNRKNCHNNTRKEVTKQKDFNLSQVWRSMGCIAV